MAVKRTRRVLLKAAVLLALVGLSGRSSAQTAKAPSVLQPAASTVLTRETMREDLDYLVRVLENVHPATYRGFSEDQQAVIDAAYLQIEEPMATKEFFFVVNTIICSLQDGHTQLRPMKNLRNWQVDLPLIRLHDGFYVRANREPFRQGDKLVAIGGHDTEAIYHQMRGLIPAENEHYRKESMAKLIQKEEYLDHLGLVEGKGISVRVERGGTEMTVTAPLKHAARCWRPPSTRPWVDYQIDANSCLGVFQLDQCIPNDLYKKTVRSFFEAVRDQRITNVAIDVRRNGGGNSQVIDEFFRYLDIEHYRHYGGDVRYSEEVAEKVGYSRKSGYRRGRPRSKKNRKVEDSTLLFDGNVFVLTSVATFSSGHWFAVLAKDNDLGTIVGEPTGNAPSSYGDVPTFRLPRTGFTFTVSHKRWVRPNPKNDPADALYPDILVYTTLDDVINGIDPQLDQLRAIVREKNLSDQMEM
jgi:C-terminal processing protease CtpA/Prc